jgi:hypothetical protein
MFGPASLTAAQLAGMEFFGRLSAQKAIPRFTAAVICAQAGVEFLTSPERAPQKISLSMTLASNPASINHATRLTNEVTQVSTKGDGEGFLTAMREVGGNVPDNTLLVAADIVREFIGKHPQASGYRAFRKSVPQGGTLLTTYEFIPARYNFTAG